MVIVLLVGKLIKNIFLEELRDEETENVRDRLWGSIVDVMLAMSVFPRDDFGALFLSHFGLLLLVKAFHWLVADRVDWFARGSHHTLGAHIRLVILMISLFTIDLTLAFRCGAKALAEPSMMILFAFDYTILLIAIVGHVIKYGLNCYDLSQEDQWEKKGAIVLYLDFFVDILSLLVYFGFFISLMSNYGLPLHLVRQIYVTFTSFWKRVLLLSRFTSFFFF